jgi:hypothetical protein
MIRKPLILFQGAVQLVQKFLHIHAVANRYSLDGFLADPLTSGAVEIMLPEYLDDITRQLESIHGFGVLRYFHFVHMPKNVSINSFLKNSIHGLFADAF